MRYAGLRPELSRQIESAGPQVQRRLALSLIVLVTERVTVNRGAEVLTAVHTGDFGDTELRAWVGQQAKIANSAHDKLWNRQRQAEDAGEPVPDGQDDLIERAHMAASAYEVLYAALDSDPNTAAQEVAFLARRATSDDEAETAVGWILREAGYDVSRTVFWLPTPTAEQHITIGRGHAKDSDR
ncbi:hypothetical protein GCM10009765_03730 [Fodinicola feengrottensis]|uniref:Uncharacterized protein n=1 Tax=Fodinicola feengrottensis TaxID=435914 RepID=A0ABN2FRK2_9ACTN